MNKDEIEKRIKEIIFGEHGVKSQNELEELFKKLAKFVKERES